MTSPLETLKPRTLWRHFDAIRQIPRPSKREEKIAAHVRDWAARQGYAVRADAASNLLVSVPASPGREAAPAVALQSHLDMVCEKNTGVEHDFDHDPIAVEVDGDWVKARGTTLGADNGIGVAAAMAVADDGDVVHGPLELLFTLDEETGLNGASALDPELVSARLLVNLDSEEDGAVYIGCAGAGAVEARVPLEREATAAGELRELALRGLAGGHSGVDVHKNRASAVKVLAHLLLELEDKGTPLALVALDGGSARNALPRECSAVAALDEAGARSLEDDLPALRQKLAERHPDEKGLELVLSRPQGGSGKPLTAASRGRLLGLAAAAHHGVVAMSQDVPGLVETSNNLAVVRTEDGEARFVCCPRSSSNAALFETLRSLEALFHLAGARTESEKSYPGWQPDPESPLLARAVAVHEELFGSRPEIKAVHAGLECGILVEKLPGLDAVSIGPDLCDPHSPDERVSVSSVERFYRFLGALLDAASSARG